MDLQERRHPATAVSLTAVAAAVVAIVSFILNPLVALVAAAIALVCGIIGFVRLRNTLGVVVLAFGLLPFLLAIYLLVQPDVNRRSGLIYRRAHVIWVPERQSSHGWEG